ncbi:hypothetical protein LSH36_403g03027 [Paralvinella palmiformis]|uniref:LEM domain-containing protein n=1 Tax=Paralvinella palmiformis TaxID=53620 RepID=A0AAD9JDU2_9ANNE|nr:hypothetical protein LSH36_403g03027 [Paralvinella palmiformis]
MDEIDVQSLSDEELREQLGSYNVECGPILASTRRVYEKKLLKVLSGEVTSEPSGTTDFVDYSDDYDEEPVDDEVTGGETAVAGVRYTQHVRGAKYLEPTVQESKFSQERSEAIRQRVMLDPEPNWKGASQKLSRDDIHSTSYSRISRYTSSSLASSKPSAMSTLTRVRQSQGQPPADMKKKKGLSIWVQLIIVVIIALIIFMVFQNLEPANILPTHYIDNSN